MGNACLKLSLSSTTYRYCLTNVRSVNTHDIPDCYMGESSGASPQQRGSNVVFVVAGFMVN